ncbi:MAG: hypothetical protein JKY65_19770 [Planctomycetes bacterium]|nr:hypothetical protein [Planctomycetota bacterium]
MNASERFHGLSTLLGALRPGIRKTFFLTLALTLGCGVLVRTGLAPLLDRSVIMILAVLVGVIAPIAVAGQETLGVNPGGRSRRELLLASPIGAWTLPAFVQLGSLLLILAVVAGALPAVAVFGLPGTAIEGLTCLVVLGCAWTGFSFLAAVGNNPSSGLLLLGIVPLLLLVAPIGAGYGEPQVPALLTWFAAIGVLTAAFLLAIPYVLYSRPRHLWDAQVTLKTISSAEGAIWLGGMSFIVCAFVSVGWALVFGVPAVGLAVRSWRRRTVDRRHLTSNLNYGAILGLVVFLPVLAIGVVGDCYFVSKAATYDAQAHVHGADAPQGGRRVVLLSESVSGIARVSSQGQAVRIHAYEGPGRVVVLEALGRVEHVFPQRFGVIDRHSWSSDGRYLAVHDETIGRIQISLPHPVHSARWSDFPDRVGRLISQCVQGTVVLDTESGEFTRLPLVELRPGWTHPDQLIEQSLGLSGQHVLTNRLGHRVEDQDDLTIVRYTSEGAIVSKGLSRFLMSETGLNPAK